jgi:hypothetical protein
VENAARKVSAMLSPIQSTLEVFLTAEDDVFEKGKTAVFSANIGKAQAERASAMRRQGRISTV